MNPNFRTLTALELHSVAGGFYNPLPEPEPIVPPFWSPIPVDPNPPDPDPSWGFSNPIIINPFSDPEPEPALPGKPGRP